MSDPSQMGPNMGAILSSQAGGQPGGATSTSRLLGHGWSELPGICAAVFNGSDNMLAASFGSFGNHGLFKGLGQGGIDGGLVDTLFRGLDASKETAFKTPEIGAGGVHAEMANPQDGDSGSSSSGETNAIPAYTGAANPQDGDTGSTSSGDAHAFPTTMGSAKSFSDNAEFIGSVNMGMEMGSMSPSASPGMGSGKSAGMEM